jgi:hypothetical protein
MVWKDAQVQKAMEKVLAFATVGAVFLYRPEKKMEDISVVAFYFS